MNAASIRGTCHRSISCCLSAKLNLDWLAMCTSDTIAPCAKDVHRARMSGRPDDACPFLLTRCPLFDETVS
jgi:hypothetical protein